MKPNAPSAAHPDSSTLTLTIFGIRPAEIRAKDAAGKTGVPASAFLPTDPTWQWPTPLLTPSSDDASALERPLAKALNGRHRFVPPLSPMGRCPDDLDSLARARVLPSVVETSAAEALRADLAVDPLLANRLAEWSTTHADWVAVSRVELVHLQAATDHAVVFGPRFLNLPPADWQSLLQDLNDWLAEDGLHVFTARSGRHYLAYTAAGQERLGDQDLPPLACALNRNAQPFLSGDAVRPLRRWLTELQMWLYTHPLNAARSVRGQPELNCLWLSGRSPVSTILNATLPTAPDHAAPLVYTDSAVLAGAIRAEWGVDAVVLMAQPVPKLAELTSARQRQPGRALHLVFTEPAWCYLEGDVLGWGRALDAADDFLRQIKENTPDTLSFTLDDGRGQSWRPRGNRWIEWLRRLTPWMSS